MLHPLQVVVQLPPPHRLSSAPRARLYMLFASCSYLLVCTHAHGDKFLGSYLVTLMGLLRGSLFLWLGDIVVFGCLHAGRMWGSTPSASLGAAARTTCSNIAPLDLVDLVSIKMNEDRVILLLLLTLPSIFGWWLLQWRGCNWWFFDDNNHREEQGLEAIRLWSC